MPKLIRLYIVNGAIGFALAVAFVALLIWADVAHLRHLILETESGPLAAVIMVMFHGVVFAGAQFAIAVMQMAEPQEPRGGRRPRQGELQPIRVTLPTRR